MAQNTEELSKNLTVLPRVPKGHPLFGPPIISSFGSRIPLEPRQPKSETAPAPPESPPSKLET